MSAHNTPPITQDPRHQLGAAGEAIAATALQAAGLTIVTRNWRCAAGELDIVAQEEGPDYTRREPTVPWLVLVEVRTRRGTAHGTARESIGRQKRARLREVARRYVRHTRWTGPWRIDCVAIQLDARGHLLAVEHIRHAVRDE